MLEELISTALLEENEKFLTDLIKIKFETNTFENNFSNCFNFYSELTESDQKTLYIKSFENFLSTFVLSELHPKFLSIINFATTSIKLKIILFLIDLNIDIDFLNTQDSLEDIFNSKPDISTMRRLIEKSNIVNFEDKKGNTLLHHATKGAPCIYENLPLITLLVRRNADVNARNEKRETPLHYAMECFKEEFDSEEEFGTGKNESYPAIKIVQYLLDKGTDPNAKTQKDDTPLHFLINSYDRTFFPIVCKAISLLVDRKVDINAQNKRGETILSRAVINLDIDAVCLLLFKYKVDTTILNYKQQNLLHILLNEYSKDKDSHCQKIFFLLLDSIKDLKILDQKDASGKNVIEIIKEKQLTHWMLELNKRICTNQSIIGPYSISQLSKLLFSLQDSSPKQNEKNEYFIEWSENLKTQHFHFSLQPSGQNKLIITLFHSYNSMPSETTKVYLNVLRDFITSTETLAPKIRSGTFDILNNNVSKNFGLVFEVNSAEDMKYLQKEFTQYGIEDDSKTAELCPQFASLTLNPM